MCVCMCIYIYTKKEKQNTESNNLGDLFPIGSMGRLYIYLLIYHKN